MYKIFEELCESKGVTPYRVCKETGLTTATISNWKAGRYTPKQDKLQKIADYFGVTIEYLMTGEKTKNDEEIKFSAKDERDIAKDLENLRNKLTRGEYGPASFDGEMIPEEDNEMFLGQVEIMLRRLKAINKEKYNPHKNKK